MTPKPHMTLPNGERLYEGEYGITRNGDRVGPLRADVDEVYPWWACATEYTDKGEYHSEKPGPFDIIARAEPAISLDTLENLTTPLGLLDDATREALKDHGGPYEYYGGQWYDAKLLEADGFAHRVKRQPKVETVEVALYGPEYRFIGKGAIDKINGEYDLTTVRPWVEGEQ